jgi:hypothetical protein
LSLVVVIVIPTSVARVAFTTNDDARPRLRIAPFSRVTALDARRARASPPIRAAAEIVRIVDVDVEHPPVIPLVALKSLVHFWYRSRLIDRARVSSSTSSSRRPLPSTRRRTDPSNGSDRIGSGIHSIHSKRRADPRRRPVAPFAPFASFFDRSIDGSIEWTRSLFRACA